MIGRKRELNLIQECRDADRSKLVVVYGRRRVGKTFLIREAFDYRFTFTHTGIENGTHARQIKSALGIAGVATEESAWVKRAANGERGAQIDLVIRRGDRVTNLCEMKFASGEYEISSAYETALRNKMEAFRRETKTKDTLHLTFVTTYGLVRNSHASIARSQVTLEDLFRQ